MRDLISRSELLKAFNNKNMQITYDLPVEEVLGEDVDLDDFAILVQDAIQAYKKMVIDTIKKQPTAYDIDKVVEELKDWSFETKILVPNNNELGEYEEEVERKIICTQNAIEIVKQGGVAYDVCEWKSASDGEFIQNPHTKRLYSNEPSMQNVYCNTCGKKIKIVGDCCRYRDNRTYLDIIYELIKADMLESDCAKEMESD